MRKSASLRKAAAAPATKGIRAKASGAKPAALRTIQSLITGALFRPLGSGDRMQRDSAAVAEAIIKPNDRLSSFDRLEIYNQQYWWRLLGCFQDDFRGLRAVVGERRFDRIANAYLHEHGSTSWSLRDLGQHLHGFLAAHPALTVPHTALALEMVQVEWAKIVAFDTGALPVVDAQKVARKDPAKLRVGLQPYVTLLKLAHPVDFLLRKVRDADVETGSASNAVSTKRRRAFRLVRAKPSPEPIHIAVHRADFSVYYKRLEPEAFALLQNLRSGATLADACESAFRNSAYDEAEAAGKIGEWFNVWMRLGWLTR
jgi:hypothetical protein